MPEDLVESFNAFFTSAGAFKSGDFLNTSFLRITAYFDGSARFVGDFVFAASLLTVEPAVLSLSPLPESGDFEVEIFV